jgi:hypothetical protein
VCVVPLTQGKISAIYTYSSSNIYIQCWNGYSWNTEATYVGYGTPNGCDYSAVAQGDNVHIVFLVISDHSYIRYTEYFYSNNSFADGSYIQIVQSDSDPVISIDPNTNDLYVFWAGYPTANHIYYRKYIALTGSWTNAVDWIDESTQTLTYNDVLTSFYQVYGNKLGILYETNSTSPYYVKFASLLASLTVYVTDVNNVEKSGATLTLTRADGFNYTSIGLSPVTAQYYNATHARYIWDPLEQVSSYTVTASLGGQTASTTIALTANTEITLTLPAGTTSPGGPGGPGGVTLYFDISFKITNLQNISLANAYVQVVEQDTNLTVWAGFTDENGRTPTLSLQSKTYIIQYSKEGISREETVYPTESKEYTLQLPVEVSAIPPTVQNYGPYIVFGLITIIIMFSAVSVKVESSKKRSSKYKNIHRKWNSRRTVKDLRKRWEKSW